MGTETILLPSDVFGFTGSGGKQQQISYQGLLNNLSTSAMTYGADPTGASDSTDAIREAVAKAAVPNAAGEGGQTVFLPYGLYETSETIVVPNKVRIAGVSARGTQVRAAAGFTGTHMFEFVNGTSAMFDTGMSRMTVNCNAEVGLSGILHNAPHENTEFDNLLIRDFDTYGLEIANAYEGASHFLMNNCELQPDNGATGIYMDTGIFATTLVINGLTINGAATTAIGIHLVSQYCNLIATMYHQENVTDAVYVTGANCGVTMIGCRGQSNVVTQVRHLDAGNNRRLRMINCSKHGGTNLFSDGTYTETSDIADFKVPHIQAFTGDATPSVGNRPGTVQIGASGTAVTAFDDAVDNQEWLTIFPGVATIDMSANSSIVGNAGVDFVSAAGDAMFCRHYGGVTYCFIADKA